MNGGLEIVFLDYAFKIWEVLAVLGVVLAALEVFIPGFVLLPIGLAFGLTAVMALFVSSPLGILFALGFNLFLMIWIFNKKIKRIRQTTARATNINGLIGQELKITHGFDEGDYGQAKLYGDRWTVYSKSNLKYETGDKVKVMAVDGNKLVIK